MARRKPKVPAPPLPPPPPPLIPNTTTRFRKDVERQVKRGADMEKFKSVIEALCSREPLAPEYRDHALKGDWKGWRDCHVEPDWLVLYRKTETELILGRTGTHADLFE